ncbi:MAG: aminopeptidase P family protein [Pseudomonadota bacterium]
MFQSFDESTNPNDAPPRLVALRKELVTEGLQGFIVPRADAHQGEYVANCDARLAWLTGFTGSAGFCVVLLKKAGLFVDGRYRLQARDQAPDEIDIVPWPEEKAGPWIVEHAARGDVIGFDPWLHTRDEITALEKVLSAEGLALKAVENQVDRIWQDRPSPPQGAARAHAVEFAGEESAQKRARLAADLREAGQKAAVLTLPDSICWLLNIRGSDIPRIPIVQAFAIFHNDARLDLFCAPQKLETLSLETGISAYEIESFGAHLSALEGPVRVDPMSAPQAIETLLTQAECDIAWESDICALPKARKNAAELAGARKAHGRDAIAMVQFLAWLDATAPGGLTEIDVVKKIEGFRQETGALQDISFETISGSGPNGAIVHYRVNERTNRALENGELLLVDSGGQYLDGTTDITRTIAVGPVGDTECDAYTQVLKGLIAVSRVHFPKGLAGRDLDALARQHLWAEGLDYAHGTGHGVGSYLSVHEGPQRLSRAGTVPFEPGMIVSNEPGYYEQGAFGIRLENLIAVSESPHEGRLAFETLTYVPFDRRLIDVGQLSAAEITWLNAYHTLCHEMIAGSLPKGALTWLEKATQPL